jgi:signal peptide peptidase SppA
MRLTGLVALLAVVVTPALATAQNEARFVLTDPARAIVPYQSVATADDAQAMSSNPAGMAVNDGFELSYFHGFAKNDATASDAVFLKLWNVGFGYQGRSQYNLSWNKFSIPLAFEIADSKVYVGASLDILDPGFAGINNQVDVRLGLLWRVFDVLSFGVVARNLTRPDFIVPVSNLPGLPGAAGPAPFGVARSPIIGEARRLAETVDFGLAFRPFTRKVTLAADVSLIRGQSVPAPVFHTRVGPFWGLTATGTLNTSGAWAAGLNLDLMHAGGLFEFQSTEGSSNYQIASGVRVSSFRRDAPPLSRDAIVLTVDANVVPERRVGLLGGLFGPRRRTLGEVIEAVRRAATDDDVKALVLRIRDADNLALSDMWELRREIFRFKEKSGKPVYAHFDSANKAEYLLATAADQIYATPSGLVTMPGFSATLFYLKRTLDWIGVKFDLVRAGQFKSAAEPLIAEAPSSATVQAVEAVLDAAWDEWRANIAEARKLDDAVIRGIVENMPALSTPKAKDKGLIDGVAYWDEIEGLMESRDHTNYVLADNYFDRTWVEESWRPDPTIAVVEIAGTIVEGPSRFNLLLGESCGSDTIVAAINAVAADQRVEAIVLRVNSPGGSGLASDLIWRAVDKARAVKPVVVSMGERAASGGYYVAAPADEIFVSPYTQTGSIGVFIFKPDLSELVTDKLKVGVFTFRRGAMADGESWLRGWTDAERKLVQSAIDESYALFLDRVHAGRGNKGLTRESLAEIAQGRVWPGRKAVELHLADGVGNMADAIEAAKVRAKIPAWRPVRIVTLPERGFFAEAARTFESLATAGQTEERLTREAHQLLTEPDQALSSSLFHGRPAWLDPVRLRVE